MSQNLITGSNDRLDNKVIYTNALLRESRIKEQEAAETEQAAELQSISDFLISIANPEIRDRIREYSSLLPDGTLEIPLYGRLIDVPGSTTWGMPTYDFNRENIWAEGDIGQMISVRIPLEGSAYFVHSLQEGKHKDLSNETNLSKSKFVGELNSYTDINADESFYINRMNSVGDMLTRSHMHVNTYNDRTYNDRMRLLESVGVKFIRQLESESKILKIYEKTVSTSELLTVSEYAHKVKQSISAFTNLLVTDLNHKLSRSQSNLENSLNNANEYKGKLKGGTIEIPYADFAKATVLQNNLSEANLLATQAEELEVKARAEFLDAILKSVQVPEVRKLFEKFGTNVGDSLEIAIIGRLYSSDNLELINKSYHCTHLNSDWLYNEGSMIMLKVSQAGEATFTQILQSRKRELIEKSRNNKENNFFSEPLAPESQYQKVKLDISYFEGRRPAESEIRKFFGQNSFDYPQFSIVSKEYTDGIDVLVRDLDVNEIAALWNVSRPIIWLIQNIADDVNKDLTEKLRSQESSKEDSIRTALNLGDRTKTILHALSKD